MVAQVKMYTRNTGRVMNNIHYSHICVIYVLRPCVVGFALHNIRNIFSGKMELVMFNISTT